ncbi:toll/interleukin-1 receptor domain-containing protein [Hyalangium sp.]|uniref:toll/interleukin-1 receptor domain-containing protein n=1 Tax=Hyalangium sp. TaxID=2028555 RepID=UPI002D4A8DAD|nr:toll/interleukin-1 receptor domain-containing protein [Hyalangium sp.]HYH97488.1 toll/interleukin-1 receptor domain-containing protein [Hyalangium sp.]
MTAHSSASREFDSPRADVFIGYSSADRHRVRPLVEQLERAGWRVWWDRKLLAGSSFQQKIEQALELAGCVIVVWSKNAVVSDWVIAEADEGRKRQILIPVSLDGVTPPLQFRTRHTVDLSGWREGPSPEVVEVLRAVEALLGPPPLPPKSTETVKLPVAVAKKVTAKQTDKSPVAVAKKVPAKPSKAAKPGPSDLGALPVNIKNHIIAGVAVVLLGLISTVVAIAMESSKGGLIMVTVEPATARVELRLDGQPIKPNTVIELEPGVHKLFATAAGFLPHEQAVSVTESAMPSPVQLKLKPAGAENSPDEQPAESGKDPDDARDQPKNPPGTVAKNPDTPAEPDKPNTFAVLFVSDEGAEVLVDGKSVGQTPNAKALNLTVGKTYRFVAKRAGYKPYAGEFKYEGISELEVEFELEKEEPNPTATSAPQPTQPVVTPTPKAALAKLGRFAASTSPSGAQIWVDGKDTGRLTPVPIGSALMLPVGRRKIVFKLNDKQSKPQTVTITEGEVATMIVPIK